MSLALSEARGRAALLADVEYEVHLTLSAEAPLFGSTSLVRFGCAQPGATTFLELADGADVVVTLNDEPLPSTAYDGRRIELADLAVANEARVQARPGVLADRRALISHDSPGRGRTREPRQGSGRRGPHSAAAYLAGPT